MDSVPFYRYKCFIYGLYLGLFQIVMTVLMYGFDLTVGAYIFVSVLSLAVPLVFMIRGTIAQRNQMGGAISYSHALLSSLIVLLMAGIVNSVFTFGLSKIDSNYSENIKHKTIDTMEKLYSNFNLPEEQMEKQMEAIESQDFRPTPMTLFRGLVTLIIIGFFISLILAIFLKKSEESLS